VFGSKYFILNETPKVTKFDSKSIEWIFVGYSSISKVYKVYIPISQIVVESIHVKFDGVENINAMNENQAIIVDVQKPPTTQETPITMNGEYVIEIIQQKYKMLQQLKKKKDKLCKRSITH
jgi:hypothetical protein